MEAHTHSLSIPDSKLHRIVIVGAGFGGLELVKKLDTNLFQVVILDKNNFHTFQPLLYQVATAGLNTESIASPVRDLFRKNKNFYFRIAEVTGVSNENNEVFTSIGTIKFDTLIFATGTTTNFFGNIEIEKNAMPMKKLSESLTLRSRLLQNFENALLASNHEQRNSHLDVVIVGGGPTGVELAGAIAELRKDILPQDYSEINFNEMDIDLIEGSDRLLNGMSDQASKNAAKYLNDYNVNLTFNTFVTGYDGEWITLNNGKQLRSRNLIWAAGVKAIKIQGIPEESYMKGSDRMIVDEYNAIKGLPSIYAVGDTAYQTEEAYPKGHPMVAPVAIQQATLLAKNLKNKIENKALTPFKYFNKGSMATIGRNKAVVDIGFFKTQGVFAWLIWMFVHLMSIFGGHNKVLVLMNWVWSYFTFNKSSRIILHRNFRKEKHVEVEKEEILEV